MSANSPRRPPQPVRRPKVAGLRRPSPTPRPRPRPDPAPNEVPETSEVTQPADVPEEVTASEEVVPEQVPPEEVAALDAEDGGDQPRRARKPFVVAGVLLVVALVLAGLAVWFKIEDNHVSAATSNTALLDVARTSQVDQAATSAIETLFSYDFNNVPKTQNAAKDLLLNDDVRAKYNGLMSDVQRLAPQQKLVVTVKASRSAVLLLDGDRAKVMVFVDQTATRTDLNQTQSGSAQLWVTMQYVDGKWKVDNLDTYNSPSPAAPAPAPAPSAAPSSAPRPSR